MSYHISKTVDLSFQDAVERTTAVLAENGFGIMTTIDVTGALKKKIDVDYRPYIILGACNPKLAKSAIDVEPRVGAMLPCNVVVQELDGKVEISAIDPVASMQAIDNADLKTIITKVKALLETVIADI